MKKSKLNAEVFENYQSVIVRTSGEILPMGMQRRKLYTLELIKFCIHIKYAEFIKIEDDIYMIIDEMGLLKPNQIINNKATYLLREKGIFNDEQYIVGDAMIIDINDIE